MANSDFGERGFFLANANRMWRIRPMNGFSKAALALLVSSVVARADVHFGNGIKIGEVDSTSAIVWVRLTDAPERRADGTPFKDSDEKVPEGLALRDMKDSLTGAAGSVRLRYLPEGGEGITTPSQAVDPQRDFTAKIRLTGLKPATAYKLFAEGFTPGGEMKSTLEGRFVTAPSSDVAAPVRFTVVTCHDFPRRDDGERGHLIYPAMAKLDPHFLVHAGDIEYYDKPGPWAKNAELARYKWNRFYSLANQRSFHAKHASYFMKDDHDTLKNDCWPGQKYGDLTWEQGLAIFREQFPMGEKPYRTVRWGKDLQIWMLEGRDFRSPNSMRDGPQKTILGAEQKKWLFETMRASDAAFRILISPTPILGPDRGGKNDNLANKGFHHESAEVRSFLDTLPATYVICGDRHWQYVSREKEGGVTEFSCGPGSDSHAGGFSMNNRSPEHRFLRIKGGFLSVEVDRDDDRPRISFRHHDVLGKVVHEETFSRQPD
jgi:alkaline phosphatase D